MDDILDNLGQLRSISAVAVLLLLLMWESSAPFGGRFFYFFSSTTVLFEPSGAASMPGGDCPCGLSAGAPPDPVLMGPVGPWGCC